MKCRAFTRALAAGTLVLAAIASGCTSSEPTSDDSDFWSVFAFPTIPIEVYASIDTMATASDLVVIGMIDSVTIGREWGDEREPDNNLVASLLLHVKVSDVLRGDLPDGISTGVTWEYTFPQYNAEQLAQRLRGDGIVDDHTGLTRQFPEGQVVLFLRVRGDAGSELRTIVGAEFAGGVSYRLVTPGGIVAEGDDGQAYSPLLGANIPLDEGGRPLESEGVEEKLAGEITAHTFSEVVELARSGDR